MTPEERAEICFIKPLYEKISIPADVVTFFAELQDPGKSTDSYCVECKKERPFVGNRVLVASRDEIAEPELTLLPHSQWSEQRKAMFEAALFLNRPIIVQLSCQGNKDHKFVCAFVYTKADHAIIKIGQYPSIADLAEGAAQRYRKFLSSHYAEFRKAIGLVSHGIGIGSFVYLRRIFEILLEEARQTAERQPDWDKDAYDKGRVQDRIKILKEYLPELLVKHAAIYGILSKGIHELNEQECLHYFPVVRSAIEDILEEKVIRQERAEREAAIKSEIAKIAAKVTVKS